jgi:hypothetical protein
MKKVKNGSDPITLREWVKRLKAARERVRNKNTGCAECPTKCHHCALRNAGIHVYGGPDCNWSLSKPRSRVLAMFDASIAAQEER